ncbi:ribosomal L1 domain-containing protein 1 [Pteropus alecto]|uniref:Ribosomal L1 domain-containing protein 1 n=1 Tax=Pteropus alecto TaxID=9402 RepID=L5KQM4_PTEAL|nr:ribosomal L1 domain-containing protein 1 [Pteropus alecto]ELK13530.1 Ribosomal L1 domain-containing protein 1 [Pteropus alecto]
MTDTQFARARQTTTTRRPEVTCGCASRPLTSGKRPELAHADGAPALGSQFWDKARESTRGQSEMEDSASTPPATSASTSATPAAPEELDKEQIKKAVEALLAHSRSRKNANGLLLNENENFFLMVVLWKIPSKELRVKLSLPHSIRSDLADICLFTKDEPNVTPEKTERFYKKLLNKHGIKTISQIIPFRTLKKEYKAYEAKLRLLGSFDFFLTDARIRRLLPSHLGRHFYNRKKVPVSVNLLAKNLSREINDSIGGTVLNISKSGSCSTIRIGHTGMQVQHIIENILAVTKRLSQKLPEKWESVKLLYVKTERSVSLPIFSSFVSSRGEAKGVRTPSQKKKDAKKMQKQKEYLQKQKEKKRNKRLMKQARKVASALPTKEAAPKTSDTPVKDPEPQKKETSKPEKKETRRVKAQNKVQDTSEEEIPLLVPIRKSPTKENVEIQNHATGKKSPQKGRRGGKKRKALALETPKAAEPKTPGKGPGKKPRIKEELEKEQNSPLGKKDPRQTPKKPEAKFFTTANKSARKVPQTAKQWSKKPKVPQST